MNGNGNMHARHASRPVWLMPLLIVGGWLLVAFLGSAQRWAQASFLGDPIHLAEAMSFPLLQSLIWALLTPFLFFGVTRSRTHGGGTPRTAIGLVVVTTFMTLAKIGIDTLTTPSTSMIPIPESGVALFRRLFVARFYYSFLQAWVLVGLYLAVTYYQEYRERERRAGELEARLSESQLQVLAMQLNPHFLFNALQSVAELMHTDVNAADRMLTGLSELLRLSFSRAGLHDLSLREEIDFLERYLEIEQIRFSERLTVDIDIEPAVWDAIVPTFILQPLVENALKHGVARRVEAGRVRISARREADRLLLRVEDDGPGLSGPARERVGLGNTRARLEQLFGAAQRLTLHSPPAGGLTVAVVIPFRDRAA